MSTVHVSIIISCYNEKDHILELVKRVIKSPIENKEIIVVDDCSTDGTLEILDMDIRPLVSKILYHQKNAGKGAALRTGIHYAKNDIIIIQDADLEYDPMEYPKLIQPIVDGKADVVYGSRFLKSSKFGGYFQNRLANTSLTLLSNCFTGLRITDMETCYKVFTREIIQSITLEEDRFGFEPEVTAKIARKGCKLVEVPISYSPRTLEEGKKIGLKDGFRALYCIWKYRAKKNNHIK